MVDMTFLLEKCNRNTLLVLRDVYAQHCSNREPSRKESFYLLERFVVSGNIHYNK